MRSLAFCLFAAVVTAGLGFGCGKSEGDTPGSSGGAGQSASGGAGQSTSGGGNGALVDCDPKKILCKRLAPECVEGEVPSVAGSCYGDCVKIDRCACSEAAACPMPEQYTCWAKTHCGPFVR